MSFELTSSQINTLHVAGVGRGGTRSHWKNTRLWERRGSKGIGRREGSSTGKGPDTEKWGRQQVSVLHGIGCTHVAAAVSARMAAAVHKRPC